jgi:hypothetical protein
MWRLNDRFREKQPFELSDKLRAKDERRRN